MFIYYLQREAIEVIPPLAIIYQQLNELNVYEKYGKTIDLLHWVLVQLRDPYITSVNKRNVRMKAYEYYIKHWFGYTMIFSDTRLNCKKNLRYSFLKRKPSSGGGQNLERPNVERTIFRKFETSNIEIKKVESFDFFIFKFISYIYVCLNCSNTQNIWLFIEFEILGILIVLQIVEFWKFTNFRNSRISEIWLFYALVSLENFY